MAEIWKDIEGTNGNYQVSNFGNVRSVDRDIIYSNGKPHYHKGRILKMSLNHKGYLMVHFPTDKGQQTIGVHRLVALHFVDGYAEGLQVNHKDENKLNNRADNLEWCSPTYNVNYGTNLQRKGIAYKKGAYTQRCKILAVYIDGVKLGEYNGYKEASEALGVSPEYISQIANGRPHKHYRVEIKRPRSYQVAQFFEGELVAVYPSISSAAKRVGADLHILSKAAKEERLFKGFTWRCI